MPSPLTLHGLKELFSSILKLNSLINGTSDDTAEMKCIGDQLLEFTNSFKIHSLLNGPQMPEMGMVHIDDSLTHGKGVFASQKIEKGDLITLYPAHYLILHPDGDNSAKSAGAITRMGVVESQLVKDRKLSITDSMRFDYKGDIDQYYSICGDPRITDNSSYLGHMINDGVRGHSTATQHKLEDQRLYYQLALMKNNSRFEVVHGMCIAVVATKDIEVGEEVFITYGYGYWTSFNTSRNLNN